MSAEPADRGQPAGPAPPAGPVQPADTAQPTGLRVPDDLPEDLPDEPGAAGFRLLPHTADVRVQAWGPTREACLEQAVRALVATFAATVPASTAEPIAVTVPPGPDVEQLVCLLEDALYCIEVAARVPVAADVTRAADGGLAVRFATVSTADVEQTGSVPKAATRHGLVFARHGSRWWASVTIDV